MTLREKLETLYSLLESKGSWIPSKLQPGLSRQEIDDELENFPIEFPPENHINSIS